MVMTPWNKVGNNVSDRVSASEGTNEDEAQFNRIVYGSGANVKATAYTKIKKAVLV